MSLRPWKEVHPVPGAVKIVKFAVFWPILAEPCRDATLHRGQKRKQEARELTRTYYHEIRG